MSIVVQHAVPTVYNGRSAADSTETLPRCSATDWHTRVTAYVWYLQHNTNTLHKRWILQRLLKSTYMVQNMEVRYLQAVALQPSIALISLSVRGHWGKILQDVEGWECAQICENSCPVKALHMCYTLMCLLSLCVTIFSYIYSYIPILHIWALTRHFSSCSKSRQPVGDGERPAVRLSLRGEKQVLS